MECLHRRHQRHPKFLHWQGYPCGKCLPCRIRKQSSWELRNRLEFLTSHSSSFVTLTIEPSKMENWLSRPPGHWVRRWLDALRASERRQGIKAVIRFFGCLEYGETFGRPHYHMLVYNQHVSWLQPIPRANGRPSTLYRSPVWPHGHIDAGKVTPASIRYCASYLNKDTSSENMLFRTTRPGIGAFGIYRLAEQAVSKLGECVPTPAYFQIGERKFPLGKFERDHFEKGVINAGGTVQKIHPQERVVHRVLTEEAKALANHWQNNADKVKATEKRLRDAATKAHQKQIEGFFRAAEQADSRLAALRAPAHFDLEDRPDDKTDRHIGT